MVGKQFVNLSSILQINTRKFVLTKLTRTTLTMKLRKFVFLNLQEQLRRQLIGNNKRNASEEKRNDFPSFVYDKNFLFRFNTALSAFLELTCIAVCSSLCSFQENSLIW